MNRKRIQQNLNRLICQIFYLIQQSHLQFQQNSSPMKVASPFIDYISDCKKNMRRLRKKIYKFIIAKKHDGKQQKKGSDLMAILKTRNVPAFLIEVLAKRKNTDLNSIKNMNLLQRLPLAQIIDFSQKQERNVEESHSLWMENVKLKNRKIKSDYLQRIRERQVQSRKTLSSTQFDYEEQEEVFNQYVEENESEESYSHKLDESLNQHVQFNRLVRGSSFFEMESSISQENLFDL